MVTTFWTAIEILRQFISMNELVTAGTFDPAAKSILLRSLDFNFWFIA